MSTDTDDVPGRDYDLEVPFLAVNTWFKQSQSGTVICTACSKSVGQELYSVERGGPNSDTPNFRRKNNKSSED